VGGEGWQEELAREESYHSREEEDLLGEEEGMLGEIVVGTNRAWWDVAVDVACDGDEDEMV
jgi:hypothetical protein